MKELIIFDLDGTLNVSKMPPDEEMADLLCELLTKTKVAVISGASFKQFEKQFLKNLNCANDKLSKLFIVPTNGSTLYKYEQNKWTQVYEETLPEGDRNKIQQAFKSAISDADIAPPEHIYGELIEDRGTQITYSALGQEAPIDLKESWDPDHKKRKKIVKALLVYIPEFEISIGGTTSIDVTKKGIDKAYGVQKIEKSLNINKNNMLFIGDAIFPGGNDYSAKETGIKTIQVSGPEETKGIIREILNTKSALHTRPWGSFIEFTKNDPTTVKIIIVNPNEEFSLQYHKNREEFWRVLSGNPTITIGDKEFTAKKGDEFIVEKGENHRISAEDTEARILEISFGEFDENDIVRLKDKYGRVNKI